MQITNSLTDEAVLAELGERFERIRLQRDLSQAALAEQAGVERKVVGRLERGEQVQLTSLVRILRALGLSEALEALVPSPRPSPVELLRARGRERQRASGRRAGDAGRSARTEAGDGDDTPPWRWGEGGNE